MSDNVEADPGTGGATFASDDIGGVQYPRAKVVWGVDGAAVDTSASNPLPVVQTGTHTVTATQATAANLNVTEASAANALTALQLIDDTVYVDDADWSDGSSKHVLVGGLYESSQQTVTDGDVAPMAIDVNGNVRVRVMASAAIAVTQSGTWDEVGINDSGNVITVDGSGSAGTAATGVVTVQGIASMTALQVQSNSANLATETTLGNVLTSANFAAAFGTAGSADSQVMSVQGIASMTPVQVSQATASNLNAQVVGAAAHDANTAVNPVQIGLRAETSLKGITLVSDADVTHAYGDADGVMVVKLNTTGADLVSERVSNTDGASTAFSNFGAVANTYNYVTALTVFRTDSASTLSYIDFRDGTAGSILYSLPLPAGGGATVNGGGTPLFKTSANTALAYDVSAALTTVYISATGFQSKV